jgi:hypothetical protein
MDLLITVLSLVVAVYAVTPRERQLALTLKLGTFDWIWVVCAVLFLCTLYLSFYPVFEARGWAMRSDQWPAGLTPDKCVGLVLLAGLGALWLRIRFARLSPKGIKKFAELAQDLLWMPSTAELLALLQDNVHEFFRIYNRDYWSARLRSRFIQPLDIDQLLCVLEDGQEPRALSPLLFSLARPFIELLHTYDEEQKVAAETARIVFLAKPFVAALANTRPYLGLTMLKLWPKKFERSAFLELYIAELLANRTSVLYIELANNDTQSGNRYLIPPSNRVLHFFLSDAAVAQEEEVYRPVGEFVITELDRLQRAPEQDPYNESLGDFDRSTHWQSPLFVAIHFFDIMVREALFQGIEWHMWLYYLTNFVDKMVRNYRPSRIGYDSDAEWPNKYSWLISRIFWALREWIEAIEGIPPTQRNVVLGNTRASHQNDNIPKSSILALGHCLRTVVMSEALEEQFKNSLVDMVFELFFHLRRLPHYTDYATALLESIKSGGTGFRAPNTDYLLALEAFVKRNKTEYLIKHVKEDVTELQHALHFSIR